MHKVNTAQIVEVTWSSPKGKFIGAGNEIVSKATANLEGIEKMKQVSFNMISVIALLASTVGCATTTSTQDKESMLVASGFKTITPKTAAQQQKLQQLPPGKVAMINKKGRTYYIFPGAAHNQLYVGGPKEYKAYQQLRAANKLPEENLTAGMSGERGATAFDDFGGWDLGGGGG
jgi:hypothetical protein